MDYRPEELDFLDILTPAEVEMLSNAVRTIFAGFSEYQRYLHLPKDPRLWSGSEVGLWLDWCQGEFNFQSLSPNLRGVPGRELCNLEREGILVLSADCSAGEILWEHLRTMCQELDFLDILTPAEVEMLSNAVRTIFAGFSEYQRHLRLPKDPRLWSGSEVGLWLDRCQDQFNFQSLSPNLRGVPEGAVQPGARGDPGSIH
ncbi:hypothetical protein SKAU_G00328860 [Synaphobranchus kaupii]|uniref:PNT domain-containing protein n=1 Tax=Synaphobranchus kaupii TaxID=118154 RepID=A0A9Q1IIE5_SYNKA|nr:hypothetical protein SKAU_G00328860 [Synaphobranchus kaupii]